MLTFHPVASLLANSKDTISTISTIRLFVYISCSHQDKNQRLSWHHSLHFLGIHGEHQATPESKLSVVAVPRYQLFTQRLHHYQIQRYNINDLYYDSILLSCTCATKEVKRFWGCGQFLLSLLSTYFLSVCEY